MTRSLATLILKNAPHSSVQDLRRVPGLPQAMLDQFLRMSREMDRLKSESAENETVLSIGVILKSYAWRALAMLVLASAAGALLYRRLRSVRWLRAAANGFAASFLVLTLAWLTTGTDAYIALLFPILILGFPAVLWQLAYHRKAAAAARVLFAWIVAAIPATFLAYPWF